MTSNPPSTAAAAVPLSPAQFRAAIVAVFLLVMLGALDQMTISVALPTIASSLGRMDDMAWVVSGYMISSTVVTPLYGKFGDMYGRRLTLAVALAMFVLGSLACALSPTLPALVIARLLQGAGAGGMVVLAQSTVADIVPLRDRGRFQGYVSIVWAAASVVGPIAGGMLTQYLSWRWIFWINLPLGLCAWMLVHRSLRALPAGHGRQAVDWLGAVLLMSGLVTLLFPITRLGQGIAPTDLGNWAWLALSLVLLAAFWWRQGRAAAPILPPELLREPTVMMGSIALFICFFVFIALCVLVPLRLQLVVGWSAASAGTFLMWLSLAIPTAVFLGGRWMTHTGYIRPLHRTGALMATASLGALIFIDPATPWLHALGLVVLGCGMGLQVPTSVLMVQNAVPRQLVGTATAVSVLFRSLGGAIGIAVLSAVVFAMLQGGAGASAGAPAWKGAADLARQGAGALTGVSDMAFRAAIGVAMVLSLANVWISRRLPDTRLHAGRA